MSHYFSKVLPLGFDATVAEVTRKLKDEGFGVITDIDVTETLETKIGAEALSIIGSSHPR